MKLIRKSAVFLLIISMLWGLCACAVNPPEPVDISSEDEALAMGFSKGDYKSEIAVGDYGYFEVIIKYDYEYEVEWISSNPEVAVVDSNGRVDALSPGKVTITAKAKKATIDYDVTVVKAKSEKLSMSTAYTRNQSVVDQNLQSANATNPYAILVNIKTGCATVYTYNAYGIYNVAVRAMAVSVGKGTKTAENSYNTGEKERWYSADDGRHYQFATEFGGDEYDYRFCSTPFSKIASASLIADEYNKLGTACTEGDIWLSVADAKWIYDNCDEGTLVKVTNTTGNDPLGVPGTMKLSDDSKSKNWDPTDSNKKNPYLKLGPTFEGLEETQVILNGTFDAYQGVTAYDTCSNLSQEEFQVDGSIPCNKEGRYIISYYFTDAMNRTTRVDRVVNVVSKENYTMTTEVG